MKTFFLLLGLLSIQLCSGQFESNFNPHEAKEMIALCNNYTFRDLYNSDKSIIPKGYKEIYTSPIIGLDNMFKIYKHDNYAVICFRGSTEKISSWVENIYSAMIPATGFIKINEQPMNYNFAKDTSASVHSGYALAITLLTKDILEQIKSLNKAGVFHFIITGHSQGGSLAHLCRAHLENYPKEILDTTNQFKTYAFANPMCGNREFAHEYNSRYLNTSFSIINPADLIPTMPFHYQEEGKLFSKKRIANILLGEEKLDFKQLATNLLIRSIEKSLKSYIKFSNRFIARMISFLNVPIEMPSYKNDINYFHVGTKTILTPFATYPKIKIDTSNFSEEQLLKMKPAEDGYYYKKEPLFYQHKPYNYYVGLINQYFSSDFQKLKIKYLPENL